MKQFYLITFLIASFFTIQAKPVITFDAWAGNWSNPNSWDLHRVPKHGDSIVIPAFTTVVMDKNDTLGNVSIYVKGLMIISKKLRLSANSVIQVTGALTALGSKRAEEVLTIGGVNKFDQNAGSWIFGPATASSNTGISPLGFISSILPVTFTSFYATRTNDDVELRWSTGDEVNNKHFELQRSVDGMNWTVLGTVKGAGTTSMAQQYQFTDRHINATIVHYRIRQVDADGHYAYSIVKTVKGDKSGTATKIYAANKSVNIEFNEEIKHTLLVRVVNMHGQVVIEQRITPSYRVTLQPANGQHGIYVVQVSDGAGFNEVKKVML